jgi:hypothetical protein
MNESNRPQYLEAPKAIDVAACNWQPGQAFRVMKMDVSDLHSAWYVVMPGGAMLTLNNCADDAQDEAQANWIASVLNAALATPHRAETAASASVQGVMGAEVAWRPHVEQRLRGWRQRFVNKSGDQLAMDNFMDERSIEDLLDYVLDEWSTPAAPSQGAER